MGPFYRWKWDMADSFNFYFGKFHYNSNQKIYLKPFCEFVTVILHSILNCYLKRNVIHQNSVLVQSSNCSMRKYAQYFLPSQIPWLHVVCSVLYAVNTHQTSLDTSRWTSLAELELVSHCFRCWAVVVE